MIRSRLRRRTRRRPTLPTRTNRTACRKTAAIRPAKNTADDENPPPPAFPPITLNLARPLAERGLRPFSGKERRVLKSSGVPGFVEYRFQAPDDKPRELWMRYAAGTPRPAVLVLNGRRIPEPITAQSTGKMREYVARWFLEGKYQLRKGENRLRLEWDEHLPLIDAIEFTAPRPPASVAGLAEVALQPADVGPIWFADMAAGPQDFTETWLSFAADRRPSRADDLAEWFDVAAGPGTVGTRRIGNHDYGRLSGCLRLKAPLTTGRALAVGLADHVNYRFHFVCRDGTVSFVCHNELFIAWSAYRGEVPPNETNADANGADEPHSEQVTFRPPVFRCLTSTDGGRVRRTELRKADTVLLCLTDRNGPQVEAWIGDARITAAALPGPLESVWAEGESVFAGLRLVETTPPDPPAAELRAAPAEPNAESPLPADLPWTTHLASVETDDSDEGKDKETDSEQRQPTVAAADSKTGGYRLAGDAAT
jgi:hypothetical protein